jgi:riboflavin synthase
VFTGLIDDVGLIERVAAAPAGAELRVRCRYDDLAPGESIALNGACLTVRECGPRWFTVAAVGTTLERTNIGRWTAGTRVNLERAIKVGDRLGGHIVQGHVDAVAEVRSVRDEGDARLLDVSFPVSLVELVVLHGSVAIDGVSLTVNALRPPDVVQLSLIEFTLRHTTLGALAAGDPVHVEADIIAKHVQSLMAPYTARVFS